MSIVGPRFFGWVMGASHPAGVAADWLVSAWGQNAGYHTPTPAASALEDVCERWLIDLLALPVVCSIGFSTGATVANAICLAAARTRVLLNVGWDPDADGPFGAPPVNVLIGADAHSSLFSSLQIIGFGYNRVRRIATDDQGRMLPAALDEALRNTMGQPSSSRSRADHYRRVRPVPRNHRTSTCSRCLGACGRRLWPLGTRHGPL